MGGNTKIGGDHDPFMDEAILSILAETDTMSLASLTAELEAQTDQVFFRCFDLSLRGLVEVADYELTDTDFTIEYSLTEAGSEFVGQDNQPQSSGQNSDVSSDGFIWTDAT